MADTTNSRMNMAAIKRVDPYVKEIVESAKHVALYTFEENEWAKTSIEGALFLFSRRSEPDHSMVIMNRLNTNNLLEPISLGGLELQVQAPFLLYRNSRCQIHGIWFYDKDDCERVAKKLESLIKSSMNNQEQTGSVNVIRMLSKAQDDFNSNIGINKNDHKPFDVTSQSVMDFFAKAGHSGTANMPTPPTARPLFGPPPTTVHQPPLLLQRLMSNPAHSVEHIEKQQRSVTPQEHLNGTFNNDIKGNFVKSINSEKRLDHQPIPIGKPIGHSLLNGQHHLEQDLNFMSISSPKNHSPPGLFSQEINQLIGSGDDGCGVQPLNSTMNPCLNTPQKPALMPPTMFAAPEPITPIRGGGEPVPEPLTRNQLMQAMNYLLKHDPDFMKKIHEAYVKSFSELVM